MPTADDQFELSRFVTAQDGSYQQARDELRRGRKTGHWMWFIFPQVAGLGRSSMAQHYAISSIDEARAYLRHPVLGPRLIECASAMSAHAGESATRILGDIDAIKLRSSMTLFQHADPAEPVFGRVLELFFDGMPDGETLRRL